MSLNNIYILNHEILSILVLFLTYFWLNSVERVKSKHGIYEGQLFNNMKHGTGK